MENYNTIDFFNKLSNICYDHFTKLPKTGKPIKEKEWTVLSCIVKENIVDSFYEVVALGTGSKCIGLDKMSDKGDVLNDSHAEVMCRRSFLRYLYEEMLLTLEHNKETVIFGFDDNLKKFRLLNNVKFHFFTTHVPCGDAAIFSKQISDDTNFGECVKIFAKRTREDVSEDFANKRLKMDIFRTGAKCLPESESKDLHGEGAAYHVTGVVRTKPGRGSPTLSVSCSDKLAKWCKIGLQGALLSCLLENPIYLETFIVAGGTPFCKIALQRALHDRLNTITLKPPYFIKQIITGQADYAFEYQKQPQKQPSASSISWFKFMKSKVEAAVDGRKQGVTKKKLNTRAGRLGICKRELMERFFEIVEKIKLNVDKNSMNYYKLKQSAFLYQEMWKILKDQGFTIWTVKDAKLQLNIKIEIDN